MFKLEDYEDVASRIKRFRETYDSGRIVVDVISHDFKEGIILIEASVYRYGEDTLPAATDVAIGIRDTYNPNMRKFYVEDTATSAIGRAIGLLLGVDKRPTREDMGRVEQPKPAEEYTGVLGNKTHEPDPWDKAQDLLASELGASMVEHAPRCEHGERKLKEGTTKAGKPYKGYLCAWGVPHCKPIWYRLMDNGQFVAPSEAKE